MSGSETSSQSKHDGGDALAREVTTLTGGSFTSASPQSKGDPGMDLPSAYRWSLLGEAATRIVNPAITLALAFVLAPADFGVVAAATVAVALAMAIAEGGIGKALVVHARVDEVATSTAFWMLLGFAGVATLLTIAAGPWVATLFGDPRIADALALMAVQCIGGALCVVPHALAQRDLRFDRLFEARLASALSSAAVMIALALAGFGFWTLVWGAVLAPFVQALVLGARGGWRPVARFDRVVAQDLLRFGRWAMATAVLVWFYGWMDALIVGTHLGTDEMGLYRFGSTLVVAAFGLVLAPLLPVLYAVLARHGGEREAIARDLERVVGGIAAFVLPAAVLLAVAASLVETLLAPHGWSGLGFLITLLAATHGIAWLVGANGEALRAAGRPDAEAKLMSLSALIYLPAFLVAARHGLEAFLWTRLALALVGTMLQLAAVRTVLGFRPEAWLRAIRRPLTLSVALALVFSVPATIIGSQIAALVAMLGVAIGWAIFLYRWEPRLIGLFRRSDRSALQG